MSQEVEEIKAKVDLAGLMSEYIKLIPAGANFKALCPFHNEKTPSLMISPSKQIWKCFGCGAGGDIFEFLMKIEGWEFPEALKILAQRAGVKLQQRQPENQGEKNRLSAVVELATKYWQKVLGESSQAQVARDYLKLRDLSQETAEDFRLGYAIDSWDNLIKFLKQRGFSEEEIFLAGLSVRKDRGVGFYDRFRGRLMFPIIDYHGLVVGFGGRVLQASDLAKYINTPQTAIYNKSLILYGFYQAKEAIKKENLCILVEGYLDVLPSHQAGVKNVAAISGTALTWEQLKIIKRYTNNIALALDMDAAGQQAAWRSIDLALEEEFNVKVITLPFGKDPGECIKNNPADWPRAISQAQEVMEYFFAQAESKYQLASPEGKKMAAKFLLERIAKIGNKIEQDHWLKKLATRLEVSESILRELISKTKTAKTSVRIGQQKTVATISESQEKILFRRLMSAACFFPPYLSKIIDNLALEFLTEEETSGLYKKIVLFYNKNIELLEKIAVDKLEIDLLSLLTEFSEAEQNNFLPTEARLLDEIFLFSQKEFIGLPEKEVLMEMESALKLLKDDYLKREIAGLKAELERAEKESEPAEKVEEIYRQLSDLIKQRGTNS